MQQQTIMMCIQLPTWLFNAVSLPPSFSCMSKDTKTRKQISLLWLLNSSMMWIVTIVLSSMSCLLRNLALPLEIQTSLKPSHTSTFKANSSVANLLLALCDALSVPAYSKYLKTKLNWTQSNLLDINWPILQTALESFQPKDQHQIILFINEKLLLRASKAHPHMGSTLCPLFQRDNKDTWHFLECMHPECITLFNELKCNLTKATQHFHLYPCIHTSIWLGLTSIRHHLKWRNGLF